MDYEKKYKEALSRAKDLHDNHALGKPFIYKTCEDIFPELKEREDEKWRKWLIGHLKGYINITDYKYAEVCKKAIAWLKKQGEQKLTDEEMIRILRTEYEKGRADAIAEMQKPEWSEEDEKMLSQVINEIEAIKSNSSTIFEKNIAQDKLIGSNR